MSSSPPHCLQEQLGTLTATLDDLDARLREMNTRVREGAALPAEAAAIEAAVLSSVSWQTRFDRTGVQPSPASRR